VTRGDDPARYVRRVGEDFSKLIVKA